MSIGNINYSSDIIKSLLPSITLFPIIKPKKTILFDPYSFLENIRKIQMNWIQFKMSFVNGATQGPNKYGQYLQYPNTRIKDLAVSIVSPGDTNDEKAYKVMRWVQENIDYKSDIKNYKRLEFWAFPTLTASKSSGDCEDGAFLMHSIMLNAGIPWEMVRTYGGLVVSGQAAQGGGHAWTAYKRETDNQWVVLDWCYHPEDKLIGDREPMRTDVKYIDDFFYVNVVKTVETPLANKVRNPAYAIGTSVNTYA